MDTNGNVSIIAGTGLSGFSGDSGPATSVKLRSPLGITVDSIGNVFFSDEQNQRIKKIDIATGIISTIAGTGPGGVSTGGFSGDGLPASNAQLNEPSGLCFDNSGNMYISDNFNYRVRKIDNSGIISTFAGNGLSGSIGDDGPATAAKCAPCTGIIVDIVGNLYFTQTIPTIRKVNVDGIISTIAGDTISNVYNGDGIPATSAHMYGQWLAIDKKGLMYISDQATNARIRKIDSLGIIYTVAGIGLCCSSGDGGPATSAEINPSGMAFDRCGNLFFGQVNVPRIRKVTFDTSCHYIPTGINENETQSEVTIYPNPVWSSLNIQTNNNISSILITNLFGQNVFCKTDIEEEKADVDIANMPSGVYFVAVVDEKGRKTIRKFIKE